MQYVPKSGRRSSVLPGIKRKRATVFCEHVSESEVMRGQLSRPSSTHAAAWYADAFKSETGEVVVDKAKAAAVAAAFARRAGPGLELRLGWGGRVSDVLVDMLVYFNKQIMPDDDPQAMAAHAVRVRCSELIAALPTSAEEDLAWLEKRSGRKENEADCEARRRDERRKLAVEYRLRKKALLQHFIEG